MTRNANTLTLAHTHTALQKVMRRAGRIVALVVNVFQTVIQSRGIQVGYAGAAQRFRLKADGQLAPAQLQNKRNCDWR